MNCNAKANFSVPNKPSLWVVPQHLTHHLAWIGTVDKHVLKSIFTSLKGKEITSINIFQKKILTKFCGKSSNP